MCASALCLIHCICLPWIIAIVGTYFGSMFESPFFHTVMLVLALLIGLPVFISSYLKYKSKLILVAGIIGLSLTTYGTVKSEPCCPPGEASVCANNSMESEEDCCPEEVVIEEKIQEQVQVQSFNTIPLGVTILILAHFLNFKKRKSCKHDCCP